MTEVLIVGVGGAGGFLAERMEATFGYPVLAVNTDNDSLKRTGFSRRLVIGSNTSRTHGTINRLFGQRAAEEAINELSQILAGVNTIILVAGLGGATGTGAAPAIAKMAKGLGIEVIAAVTLPMEIEATRREQASIGLIELQGTGAKVFVYDLASNTEFGMRPISDIFERSALVLSESIKNTLVVINE